MKSIGIFPGSFDPIHGGHIAFASKALEVCNLDSVYFLPENNPRSKPEVASLTQRVGKVEASIKDTQGFGIFLPSSPQFTVSDTLPEIDAQFKGARLTLLIGSDVATSLPAWENVGLLLERCNLAVGLRHDVSKEELITITEPLKKQNPELVITIIETEFGHVSSSQLRK